MCLIDPVTQWWVGNERNPGNGSTAIHPVSLAAHRVGRAGRPPVAAGTSHITATLSGAGADVGGVVGPIAGAGGLPAFSDGDVDAEHADEEAEGVRWRERWSVLGRVGCRCMSSWPLKTSCSS